MLLAEIDPAVGVGVVEKPVGAGFAFTDVERNLLVERVAGFRVKAHGIHCLQRKAPTALVYASTLVAQAEDPFINVPQCVMDRAFPQFSCEVIGKAGPVCVEEALLCPCLDAEVFLFHGEIHAAKAKEKRIRIFPHSG